MSKEYAAACTTRVASSAIDVRSCTHSRASTRTTSAAPRSCAEPWTARSTLPLAAAPRLPRAPRDSHGLRGRVKTVILAGGLGTRLAEETDLTPKPMVEIGGKPILWHIMKIYAAPRLQRVRRRLGYRAEVDQGLLPQLLPPHATTSRSTSATATSTSTTAAATNWTRSPGRHRPRDADRRPRQAPRATGSATSTFMLTYGDGVADVDIARALAFHRAARQAGDGHRRPAAGALRRARLRRRPRRRVHREAADRRRLDQRRLLRPRAAACSTTSTATRRSGSASRSSGWPPTAARWPTATTASGSRWTRSATCGCSRALGRAATCPWKVWE